MAEPQPFHIYEEPTQQKITLGESILNGGYPVEALPYLLKDNEAHPENWGHWNNLGICYKFLGRYDEAVEALKKCLSLSPGLPEATHNLGVTYEEMGRFEDCLNHYCLSASKTGNPNTNYGMATALLREKRFDLAVPLWETCRLFKRSAGLVPNIEVWRGEDLDDCKLIVTREGGHGDIFWLMRYLKNVKELGAHVTLHTFKSQHSLFAGHPWIDEVLGSDDPIEAQEFDYQIPLWSLPWELRSIGKAVVPQGFDEPYLKVDNPDPKIDKEAVGDCQKPRIGLAWEAGECLSVHRKIRSIQPELLHYFSGIPALWTSLIPGVQPDWCVAGLPKDCDWLHTAQVLAGLDLVIAVDSSLMHLAGAMGKPVLTALPLGRDWKWFHDPDRTEWYPSMKLFQNTDAVSFEPVVKELVKEVNAWVSGMAVMV